MSFAVFDYLVHFHSVTSVLLAAGALIPIVDPLGGAPIYLALTAGLSPEQRRPMAKAVSIPAVQVAGGMVVCAIAWSLLNRPDSPGTVFANHGAPDSRPRPEPARILSADDAPDRRSWLDVGDAHARPNPEQGLRSKVITAMAHTVGILIVAVAVCLCYRHAERILKRLGPTGTGVVVRLSAFILLCIGVQIIWNGVRALLTGAFPNAIP